MVAHCSGVSVGIWSKMSRTDWIGLAMTFSEDSDEAGLVELALEARPFQEDGLRRFFRGIRGLVRR